MGRRGPPPTPTRILELRGSERAKRRAEPQPDPLEELPKAPSYFNAHARRHWRERSPELLRLKLLTPLDLGAWERCCHVYGIWVDTERYLKKHGRTYVLRDKDGQVKYIQTLPQVGIARNAASEYRALCREFGLTPAARAGMASQVPGKKPQDAPKDTNTKSLIRVG